MYEGKLVRLRPLEWTDAQQYREWVNDASFGSLVDRVRPVTLEEHRRWYDALIASDSVALFAVDELDSGEFLGCVWLYGVDPRHRRAELRILLGRSHGRGRGTDAIETLVRVARERFNLHKVFAEVLESNERACRSFEKAGFQREGLLREDRFVNGRYQDVVRYGIVPEA